MSLSEALKFRKLNDELTEKEFGLFCNSFGRERIVSSLFGHFKNDLNFAKIATKIQSNIMRKRQHIEEKTSTLMGVDALPNECNSENKPSSYHCIDQLPSYLISHCASWLHYKDYFHFGYCNRNIYYSVYTPSMIQEFELNDTSCDNFSLFKNVSSLKMDILMFNRLSSSDKLTWKNNKSLRKLHLFDSDRFSKKSDVVQFLNNIHLINTENVRHLTLFTMHFEETLYGILSKFDQIEYLRIGGRVSSRDQTRIDSSNYVKCGDLALNNLKHLKTEPSCCYNIRDLPSLIKMVCHQLESLKIGGIINHDITFPRLKAFECFYWYDSYIENLENTTTLESIHIGKDIDLWGIDELFRSVSKHKSLKKLTLCIKNRKSYKALNVIGRSLVRYNAAVESMEELYIAFWDNESDEMDKNEEFGAQIRRLYQLWQAKAPGLNMKIYHGNIDAGNAGLSVLYGLESYCSLYWKQDEVGNGKWISICSDF